MKMKRNNDASGRQKMNDSYNSKDEIEKKLLKKQTFFSGRRPLGSDWEKNLTDGKN